MEDLSLNPEPIQKAAIIGITESKLDHTVPDSEGNLCLNWKR